MSNNNNQSLNYINSTVNNVVSTPLSSGYTNTQNLANSVNSNQNYALSENNSTQSAQTKATNLKINQISPIAYLNVTNQPLYNTPIVTTTICNQTTPTPTGVSSSSYGGFGKFI
jgi:hypothetical protein